MATYETLGLRQTRGLFLNRMQTETQATWIGQMTQFLRSDQQSETYGWLGQVPAMRKWIGQRQKNQAKPYKLTIHNDKYETSIGIDLEDLRRDKLGATQKQVGKMARRVAVLPNKLITDILVANGNAYDGNAFFSDRSGSAGIVRTDNQVSVNVSDTAKLTSDESTDVILTAVQRLLETKDDQGEPLYEGSMSFGVMLPVNHIRGIRSGLNAIYTSAGVSNELKSMTDNGDISVRHFVNPRLTATDTLYAFRLDPDMPPFLWQDETLPDLQLKGPESDHAFDNDEIVYGTKRSCNAALGEPGAAVKITLT